MKRVAEIFLGFLIGVGFVFFLIVAACGKVTALDRHIEILYAPDGTKCYGFIENNSLKGGNCP